jgi:putative DNA primase/helicase
MNVADAIARNNYRREHEREKNRTTHVPSIASREAAKIPLEDIYSLAFSMVDNNWALRNPERYGHDCLRLFGPDEGLSVYFNLLLAAGLEGGSDAIGRKADADWLSFNRERVDSDLYLIDLCEKMRGNDDGIDLDENPDAECWQPCAALAAELDHLTDEAVVFHAEEIAADEAECARRAAEQDAEDKAEHAKDAVGSIISLANYRIAKSRKLFPTAADLAMRKLDEAERKLAEAISNIATAKTGAETSVAIAKRVAATERVDVAKQVAQAVKARDKETDEIAAKVNARAAEFLAEVDASILAERPQFVPPSNAGPIPMPSNTVRTPMIGGSITPSDYIAFDSDEALVTQFVSRYADNLCYVAAWGKWLEWDGQRWRFDDTLHAYDLARRICREIASSYEIKIGKAIASAKTIAAVERMGKTDRRIAAVTDQWDCDPWLLNTPGGVVDLRTGELRTARQSDYMTKMTAVAPSGECPTWLAFLRRVTGDDNELAAYLQRVLGYGLTGVTTEHAMFFLYGTGANGKSVLLSTIAGIMGDYHTTAPMETFTASATERHPTDLAGLRGARLVTAIETEEGRRWAESKIKSLTGGDKVSARFMRQDFFEFTPQFKFMPAGNHKPGLRSVDEAIRRRFHLIPFAVTIPQAERDPNLAEKLKVEWPGILAWAIEGCRIWQRDGLQVPKAVEAATAAYLESEDALAAWIDERCELDPATWTSRAQLFASWNAWASAAGEFVGSSRRFLGAMEAHGFEDARPKNERGFRGIKLRHMFGTLPLPPSPRQ